MAEMAAVGKRFPKLDAVEKATGRSQYIQDMKLPGMLYGKILYSKYPHARIVNIDVARAKKLHGVRAVLTGEDIPEVRMGVYKDNPPLKSGKVRIVFSYHLFVLEISGFGLDSNTLRNKLPSNNLYLTEALGYEAVFVFSMENQFIISY